MKKEFLERISLCFFKYYGISLVKKDVKNLVTYDNGGCRFTLNGIGWYYSDLCFTVDRMPCIDDEQDDFYMTTRLNVRH